MHLTSPNPRQKLNQQKTYQADLEYFKARLTARLCVIFIAISQLISRTIIVFTEPNLKRDSKIAFLISLPFLISIALIVIFEFLCFRKFGPRIIKYSKCVEILLSFIFMGEWISSLVSSLERASQTNPPSFGISALFGFTAFAWRTLLLTFLLHHWQLKIIAPTVALAVSMGYSAYLIPSDTVYIVMRGTVQILSIALLFYCEDKIKWRCLLTNLQQEKWVRINEFILNNIPENIMILDIDGQPQFISDFCKAFLKKCHFSQTKTDLFSHIRELIQLCEIEASSPELSTHLDRYSVLESGLCEQTNKNLTLLKIETLEDLINNFKSIIKQENLIERQFLIYNGKLKVESHQDKSIEIKISFVTQEKKDYLILIFRDTTQRDLLVTLQDNNKYKDYLLASVSHELRAPLNGNINLVETAINSKVVPKNIKETLLIPALRSSKFLLHLINDILDMSQIKAQKLRLVFQPENLKDTLKDVLQLVEIQAKKKDIHLAFRLDPIIKATFCTDHMRLSQIVLNLLHNAIKFTQKGEVRLSASPVENSPSLIQICIQDSGIGMNEENLKKLFASFTRIDFEGREVINPGGVGLGLNIAYSLSILLGPKDSNGINVESVLERGSSFSFIIEDKKARISEIKEMAPAQEVSSASENGSLVPAEVNLVIDQSLSEGVSTYRSPYLQNRPSSLQMLQRKSSQSPLLATKGKNLSCFCAKILIVDDNPFNTMAFETVLGSLNMKCDVTYNGQSAIDKVVFRQNNPCSKSCRPYQMVFMDKEMPGLDGIQTVQEMREFEGKGAVSLMNIVGCTAHGSKEEVQKFLESGINECIHKPISVNMIQRLLEKYNL